MGRIYTIQMRVGRVRFQIERTIQTHFDGVRCPSHSGLAEGSGVGHAKHERAAQSSGVGQDVQGRATGRRHVLGGGAA